jgi:hypothetical protein
VSNEADEQRSLIRWAALASATDARLRMLMAIPNQAVRSSNARHMIAQGVRPGIPDLFLAVPVGGLGGLFIELKRRSGGRLRQDQKEWIDRLRNAGYAAECCQGWEEARDVITEYLSGFRPMIALKASTSEDGGLAVEDRTQPPVAS